jgi:hypothetical protein
MEEGFGMYPSVVEEVIPGRADRVLLTGVARSGTSWLIRAMAATPGTRHYYEPDNVDADPTGERPGGESGFGPYPTIDPGDRGGPFRPLWNAVFAGRLPPRRGVRLTAARAVLKIPRTVREPLIRGSSRVLTALPGGPERTAVKTIYAAFCLDWLVEEYDPRVVVLQRHPLNVVSSWRELGIPGFDLTSRPSLLQRYRDRFEGEPPPAGASELAKTAWQVGLLTTAVGDSLDRHPGWLLVNHEDLCAEPATRIRTVCDQVGLPWSSDVERFLDESNRPGQGLKPVRVTSEQANRWRGRLSDAEADEIMTVLAQFPRHGWVREPPSTTSLETGQPCP